MLQRRWRRLLAAILVRAVRDAQGDDPQLSGEARRWLASAGEDLAILLGFSTTDVESWLAQLPELSVEQLPLFEEEIWYDVTNTTHAGEAPTPATFTTTHAAQCRGQDQHA
jgi:hypothetical protein